MFRNAKEQVDSSRAEVYFKKIKIDYYVNQIDNCASWHKEIENKAQKRDIPYAEMALIEANRIYNNYSQKYDQR